MKFILASNNQKKLTELSQILKTLNIEVISLKQANIESNPDETGKTFKENAIIKAKSACEKSGLCAIADDSGLEVDALGGAPGVFSARFGGENLDDFQRNMLLLNKMRGITNRKARFVSCIAAVFPDGDIITAEEYCEGRIMTSPSGEGGFGYDPIFYSDDLGKGFAEATQEEKNKVSHRGKALNKFLKLLEEYYEGNKGE